ncbi:hypothetical protein DESUT3_02790 [Desulfuromonas versatilis]|uniref:Lipoprotein n=1 Tax=Desulfuromonas versatilis TaxID=2802975 RepID=A0ABM8HRL7_9BACT|nr:hypothetical protein [Desulfuromonas versatilis]BCR03210.1 hypothetical protein DESUT3_02790 [Desulfuromonas versatilis]
MKMIRPLLLVCLVALCGCSSHYLAERPLKLAPCSLTTDTRDTSFAALVMALEGKRWTIEGADPEAGLVQAKACRGSYCISVDGSVAENGNVEIKRTPGQYLSRSGGRLLKHWMNHLDKAYKKFSCSPREELETAVKGRRFPPLEKDNPDQG